MNPTSNEPLAIGGMTDESALHSIYRRSGLRASLGDRGGAQGFRDEGCQAFLSFWADQDRGPRGLRREARELAEAWTWL